MSFRGNMGTGEVVEDDTLPIEWNNDHDHGSMLEWENLACIGFPYGYLK